MVDEVLKNGVVNFNRKLQYNVTIPAGTAAIATGLLVTDKGFFYNKRYNNPNVYEETNDTFVFQLPDADVDKYSVRVDLADMTSCRGLVPMDQFGAGYYLRLLKKENGAVNVVSSVLLQQSNDGWFDSWKINNNDYTNTIKIQAPGEEVKGVDDFNISAKTHLIHLNCSALRFPSGSEKELPKQLQIAAAIARAETGYPINKEAPDEKLAQAIDGLKNALKGDGKEMSNTELLQVLQDARVNAEKAKAAAPSPARN